MATILTICCLDFLSVCVVGATATPELSNRALHGSKTLLAGSVPSWSLFISLDPIIYELDRFFLKCYCYSSSKRCDSQDFVVDSSQSQADLYTSFMMRQRWKKGRLDSSPFRDRGLKMLCFFKIDLPTT